MRNLLEKTILLPVETKRLYDFLTNLKNYPKLLSANTSDWSVEGEVCSFIYDNSGSVKLKLYETVKNEKIVLGTYGNNSIEFDMEFLMMDVGNRGTNFKLSVKVDLNPIMASMISSSMEDTVQDFIENLKKSLGVPIQKEQKKQS